MNSTWKINIKSDEISSEVAGNNPIIIRISMFSLQSDFKTRLVKFKAV